MARPSEAQRITSLVFYAVVVLIAYLAYRIVQPFLVEIGWAVVLAICLAPVQSRLAPRLGSARSAALLTVLVLVLLVLPALLAGLMLVQQGGEIVAYVEGQLRDRGGPMGLFRVAWEWLHARLPLLPSEEEVIERISASLGGLAGEVASRAGSIVKGALAFLFGVVITLGVLFFLLKDGPQMAAAARRLLPFGREQNQRLVNLTRDIVAASVTSMLVIAVIQALLGGLAFLVLGVPGAALWGGVLGVMSLLPAVGGALVWAPVAIWLAVSGSLVKGVVMALVGLLVLGNVDNVVRPLLLSGSARMGTLVLVISLLGGVSAFGFIGIVLGPVVAAVLTALVESYHVAADEPEPARAAAPPAAAPPAPATVEAAVAAPSPPAAQPTSASPSPASPPPASPGTPEPPKSAA